ncbi:Ku protein [Umezawaea sp. Da 62-37]|uniref:non-homologous end joining protein Ku n=1 Tax=Umezawaea sp. Da 62-37 TaxID=3075927 RepID=UPI0028F6CABD|nr:Ku protein [Umezawaea sp. Da 62-37]WNV84611.1 Ku protein [Umezawaea sp. Da 62-37]
MARAIWSGAISFGLVSIPVALYSATHDHTVHFNQFERGTSDRIRYQRINERTGAEVEYSDVVKGHDVGDGEYVVLEQDELAEIAPGRSRTIDIDTFVDLDDIDPIYFQKSYWLGPSKSEYAHPYRLLVRAMAKTNRAGIATFVMRGKQYLTAVHADGDLLALETLFFADEIRDPADVLDELPTGDRAKPKEVAMATSLIESMSGPWRPEDYRDTYTAKVEQLVRNKRKGKKTTIAPEPADATEAVDLMEALRRSVENTRKKRAGAEAKCAGAETKSAKKPTDLSELSKADLDKRARELGVNGRSKMTRADLEKAINKAS